MTKLLGAKYKTYDGAAKRAAFENGLAAFEFKNGYKARLYRYSVVPDPAGNGYRVLRAPKSEQQTLSERIAAVDPR